MKNFSTNLPCSCCGCHTENGNTFHHILRRKTYPEYQFCDWNLLPLCLIHHNLVHNRPLSEMANKFEGVMEFLITNGWQINLDKWKPAIFLRDSHEL